MGYDSRGRKVWDRQQRLEGEPIFQTDYEYDDLGRLIAVVQPSVALPEGGHARPRYEYTYDRFGNHVKTRDALNRETLFAYDFAGRQTSRTLPVAGGQNDVETWEYSTTADVAAQLFPNAGMLKKHTDFNGNENRPHYDSRGRVDVNRWYKPGNVLDLEVSYLFDNRGRLIKPGEYRVSTKLLPSGRIS
jgi:YD repeat-containing protein